MWNQRRDDEWIRSGDSRELPGVVDTIGMGYETLLARPQLIIPPVLLDLYLWLGVHLTSEPLMVRAGRWLRDHGSVGREVAAVVEDAGPRNLPELAALWLPTIRMPSFVASLPSDTVYRLGSWRPEVTLPWWGIIIAAVVFLLIGLVVGSEYLLAIAATTTGREASPLRRPIGETLRGALALGAWLLVVGAVALLVTWPILAGLIASSAVGAGASIWLMLMLFIPISWGFVCFFFSVQALFVDRNGPFAALRTSYQVVRNDFWRSMGVICAYFLVILGFPQVWRLLISEPVGFVIAIVGHAIIGTGMIAATMVFYRDRAVHLNMTGRN